MSVNQSAKPSRNGHPSRVAAMQAHGEMIRVVFLCAKDVPEVLEAVEIESDQLGVAKELFKRHKIEHVVGVVPAAQSVCKCVELPVHAGDISDTIELLVETQLSSESLDHRRAGGVVFSASQGKTVALLTAWNESNDPPFVVPDGLAPDCWVTQVAAMQMLRPERSGIIAYADRAAGTIALFAAGDRGTVARILREGSTEDVDWDDALVQAISETRKAAGAEEGERIRHSDEQCLLTTQSDLSALSSNVRGAGRGAGWLETYGIALGAALVATSDNPDSRSLASLSFSSHEKDEHAIARAGRWFTQPRNAWMSGAAAAATILVIPLALAWGRTAILESKVSSARGQETHSRETAEKHAVYQEVAKSYLPTTKLLSDLARATPLGIEIDSVNLNPSAREISLDGRAETSAQIIGFQTTLNKSGVFEHAELGRTQATDDGQVEFSLTAQVWNPHAPFEGGTDYAERTLAQRMYKEDRASNLNWKPSSSGNQRVASSRSNSNRPTGDDTSGSARSEPVRSAFNSKPKTATIPEPLTPEQLAETNRMVLMRAKIARNSGLKATEDEEVKARLTDEIRQLQERLDALKAGGAP